MRRYIIIVFVIILPKLVLAQFDSVYANIYGETVKVWNTLIQENCAFVVEFTVTISNDTITIIEHDTTTKKVTCACLFDLCISLTDLEMGDYFIRVFRSYSAEYYDPDSLYFIGSTSFTTSHQSYGEPSFEFFQSSCYELEAIENVSTIPEKYFLLNIYPNPFNATSTIEIKVPISSQVTIKLYDISGKFINTILTRRLTPGTYNYSFNGSNLASGTYIITAETEKLLTASSKIVIIK